MTNFYLKLRFLFLPFILWAIVFTSLYTFLHWFLVIHTKTIELKDMAINFAFPLVFTILFVFVWLRKRIQLLQLKTKTGDLPMLYQLVALIALCVPLIIAQHYIVTATGELSELTTPSQLRESTQQTKYYTIDNYFIDERGYRAFPSAKTSGKYNNQLNFFMHVAVPILNSAADTASPQTPYTWIGVRFSEQISNRLSDQEKDAAYRRFLNEAWEEFISKDLTQFEYLDRLGSSEDLDKYKAAVSGVEGQSAQGDFVILIPVHEPFAARNGDKLFWMLTCFGIGAAVWLLMISIPKPNLYKLKRLQNGKNYPDHELRDFLSIFLPKQDYFITPILINVNLLVFALMVIIGLGFISFDAHTLLAWGGNNKTQALQHGEWWRLLTSTFLHGGIMHLLMNMMALLFAGIFLEAFLGRVKFALLYFLTGIIASLASISWNSVFVSIGASGAIFGLYGFLFSLLIYKAFPRGLNKALLISCGIYIAINLIMGLTGGIDNAAHIGGLITGFVIGQVYYFAFYKRLNEESEPKDEPQEYHSA